MSHNQRVAVLGKNGKPLMPTKASRVKKWLASGKAKPKWSKEGIFHVQLTVDPSGSEKQDIALAIDPGSKYDGYCVSGTSEVCILGMAILPDHICRRMNTRKMLRRNRRYRKCRRRPARFSNRRRPKGRIAPSQLAKVQLRTRIMANLCKIFPIEDIVIEDVRFNHYKKRNGKFFSTVETGKTLTYELARGMATLWKINGWETATTRKEYNIHKSKQKNKLSPDSHANDALAMICWLYGDRPLNKSLQFYVWKRQGSSRRQLHTQSPKRGGVRKRYGGTVYVRSNMRKGDVVCCDNDAIGYAGGWSRGGKLISIMNGSGQRLKKAGACKVKLLSRSPHILVNRLQLLN